MPVPGFRGQFAAALRKAADAGVHVWAHKCRVTRTSIGLADAVPVEL